MAPLHQPEEIIASKYRILNCIGEGAFGTTYEAEEINSCHRVAIKAVSLRQVTDWKVLELFEREARILETLDHPAIPKYVDYFQIDSDSDRRFYLVQELVSGRSLAELVETGWHTDEARVKDIALQVLNILEYLHGLTPPAIHRDIKPQNIIRRPDGQVYLVDFGAVQDVYRNTIALSGTFVGTVGYMPMEQYTGQAFFASDLYALGATLLFLLTHRSPADLPEKRLKIDFRDRINVSPQFADWLDKILEPAVEDRFQSVAEAKAALSVKAISLSSSQVAKSELNGAIETPIPLTYPQPKGSRIQVSKTNRRLAVKIPIKAGLNIRKDLASSQNSRIFLVSIFVLHPLAIFFGLKFIAIVIFVALVNLIYHRLTTITIEIKEEIFYLKCKLFGCVLWQIKKLPRDIKEIRCQKAKNWLRQEYIYCVASIVRWHPESRTEKLVGHKFANYLTLVEQKWLVAELSDFLNKVK